MTSFRHALIKIIMLAVLVLAGIRGSVAQEVDNIPDPSKEECPGPNCPVVESAITPEPVSIHPMDQNVESTLFDIYLGDKFQGGILAQYTDQWFEIDNPADVVDQLKDLKDMADVDSLLPLLSGRIEKHREISDVGVVSYDLNTFRIILDLTPKYLKSKEMSLGRRIPDPEAGFSLQQRMSAAVSGNYNGDSTTAITNRTLVGYGKFFSRLNGSYVQDRPYQVDEMSAIGFVGDYQTSGGYLQTQGQTFANSLQFTGLAMKTSNEILLDPELGKSSRLEIFIPSRSRVEFYRAGRLLSIQVLNFGLQEVDTRGFPEGGYDVDIVIVEADGKVTRDKRFFVKSGQLASRGIPTLDIAAGVKRDEFSSTGDPVYQADLGWRALDMLELKGSAYGDNDITLGEATFTTLYENIFARGGYAFSSQGDNGVDGNISLQFLGLSFTAGAIKTLHASSSAIQPTPTPTPAPNDFIPDTKMSQVLGFQDRTSYNFSLRRGVGAFDLGLNYQYDKYPASPVSKTFGPVISWRVYRDDIQNVTLNTSWYETSDGKNNNYALSYQYKLTDKLSWVNQVGYNTRTENPNQTVLYSMINYDDKVGHDRGNRFNYSTEYNRKNGQDTHETTYNNQLYADMAGDYLQTTGFVRDTRGSSDPNTSIGVMAQSAFVVGDDGTVSVTSAATQEALLIADIKSRSTKSNFEVLLDGQVEAVIPAGKKSAVGVSPFRTYKITVRPVEGADLVNYDAKTYTVTFFPGNVVRKTWEADRVFIVLGRLVDTQGQPIRVQRIRGTKEYAVTDEEGFFQAEITGNERLYVESKAYKCNLGLKVDTPPEYFLEAGDIVCGQ